MVRPTQFVFLSMSLLALVAQGWTAEPASSLVEVAFGPRSAPGGSTMFTPMSAEQTGIVTENRYDDPKMWDEHYQRISMGETGTGIAIADYDNDGKADIFVVSKTGSCRLFRNLGGWKFEDVTEKAGLKNLGGRENAQEEKEAWKQGAVFADVDNDGWLDIYLCRFNAPNLLFINQRNGSFKEEGAARGLAVTDACGVGAFCDYDRDGWLDVYVTTNMLDANGHPNGQRGYLFRNNGNGTFANVTEKAGIRGETLSHSATWWDYDGDGWPDLYVADDFADTDRLYHNNHDGTFTDSIGRVVPHMPYSSMGADIGDINNDGFMDLFVADMAATTHEKDQRGMAYSRTLGNSAAEISLSGAAQYSRNALYLNTGMGSCLEIAQLAGLAATDWTWSVLFEDLDNDGRLDLFVTNGMNREYQSADLRDRIFQAEGLEDRKRIMRASPKLIEANLAYRNLGDLRFEEVGAAWGLNQRGVSFGAALGDLDNDGDMDVVYANYENGVTVLRNDRQAGHAVEIALRGTSSNRFGVGARVRLESAAGLQLRQLSIARGYLSSCEPVLHFGLGQDTVIDRLTVEWPNGRTQTFSPLSADRRYTITEPDGAASLPTSRTIPSGQFSDVSDAMNFNLNFREVSRNEASPQPLMPVRFRRRGPALAVGDLNGDGRDDVLASGTSGDPARLLFAGEKGLTPADASAFGDNTLVEDGPVLFFDADGDGANDVLITHGGAGLPNGAAEYQPQLYFNDGHGRFHAVADALPQLRISAGAAAAADFDRDGRIDLFIGGRFRPGQYPLSPRSALLSNQGGRFEDVTDRLAPGLREVGMVSSALWSDVDGDGWCDLLLALEWGSIKYFHNNQGQGFTEQSEPAGFAGAGTGWWTSLAAADFNGDGRPDYVAGNLGLNSQYQATAEHPVLLYYGSFSSGRPPLLIEGYYEGEKLYPRRTRKELGAVIPSILQRYPKNESYARATLPEILGADKIAAARRFAATELRSGVFLSQPDGTYRFSPLPRLAQAAPFQGVVAGDFDGDGCADIYAVQNSYAPDPGTGRFDGALSLLLRGDGHGQFTAMASAASGLVVSGDAKALAVIDLDQDGWPDFLVTRNGAATMAWRNRGVQGHRSLGVRLSGVAGNRTGIGARVRLELSDGTAQTTEIHAGSGYYSQSSPLCFFGYPEDKPPRRLSVRWPDGVTSEHPLSTLPSGTITLTHP